MCLWGRMNGAVIKSYEEDVGNKTSVYVHTAHSIYSSHYGLRNYGYTSVPNDEVLRLKQGNIVMFWPSHIHTYLSLSFFFQGIKYVLIPEGARDFNWLQGLIKGERVSVGEYINQRWMLTVYTLLLIEGFKYTQSHHADLEIWKWIYLQAVWKEN